MERGKILFLDVENFISRREHTRTSISTPGGPVGQSRRKIERIQFLSWFADFITPLHTVSYICSRAPRTFAAALPRSEGSLSSGASNGNGVLVRTARSNSMNESRNRDVRLRNALSKWTETKGYLSESEGRTMARPSDVPQGRLLERLEKAEGKNF